MFLRCYCRNLQILGILACLVSSFTQAILNSPMEILQTSIDDDGKLPSAVDDTQISKSSSKDAVATVEGKTSKTAAINDELIPADAEEAQKDKVSDNDKNETNSQPVKDEAVDKISDDVEVTSEGKPKDKKSGKKVKKSGDADSDESSKEEDDKDGSKSKEDKDDSSEASKQSHTSKTASSTSLALSKYLTESENLYKHLNPQLNPSRSIKELPSASLYPANNVLNYGLNTNDLGTNLISQLMNPEKATDGLNYFSNQNYLTPMQYGTGSKYFSNNVPNKNLQSLIDGSLSSLISNLNNYLKSTSLQTSPNNQLTNSVSNLNNNLRYSPLQTSMGESQVSPLLNSLLGVPQLNSLSNYYYGAGNGNNALISNLYQPAQANSINSNAILATLGQNRQNMLQGSYDINSLLSNGLLSNSYYGAGTGNNALTSSSYQPAPANSLNTNAILAALG